MTLGERIYQLRTEKNLSQGTLADMLNVSRQSISKWETDSSVPDLDKLVKLSDIFSLTLDELVSGKKPNTPPENTQAMSQAYTQASGFPPRKVAGTILLCMGFLVVLVIMVLGGFLWGLIFASPFVLCGIVCFLFQKNVGLWCAWMVLFTTDFYLRITTIGSFIFAPYLLVFRNGISTCLSLAWEGYFIQLS
jgi:transcriptional regulator with XRE-family HTH domain